MFINYRKKLQESIGNDYILKSNNQLIGIISEFGCGETDFHTADIERLIKENEALIKLSSQLCEALNMADIYDGYTDAIKKAKETIKLYSC